MKDNETVVLANENEAISFLQETCNNDVWQKCFIKEMSVNSLENIPLNLYVEDFRSSKGLDENIDDEAILTTMQTNKLMLKYPMSNGMHGAPLRHTAFKSLCERAGLAGPAIMTCEDKKRQKEMAPENKAQILNYGLELYSESKACILVRDNKISAVLSGDDKDYSILRQDELLMALSDGLNKHFRDVNFRGMHFSHEYTFVEYNLTSPELKKKYSEIKGENSNNITIRVLFTTSDVGSSGANITPIIIDNGVYIPVGKGLQLSHKNGANIDQFKENVKLVFSMFAESIDFIKSLSSIKINNPSGCFTAICKKFGLPKEASLEALETFELSIGSFCNALDVYEGICRILEIVYSKMEIKGEAIPLNKKIFLIEQMERILRSDFKDYDHTCSWE